MQDNYQMQAQQAKSYFLRYDQQTIIKKCSLQADARYLYTTLFGIPYRVCRKTGDLSYLDRDIWRDGNSHGEVMTLLDLLCDSREDRHPSHQWKTMQAFGLYIHQSLGEKNPAALDYQRNPDGLRRALEAMGAAPFPQGNVAYTIPVFEELTLVLQFWLGDEDFPPSLRYLWDENALMYLKYETMYFAVDVLTEKLRRLITTEYKRNQVETTKISMLTTKGSLQP